MTLYTMLVDLICFLTGAWCATLIIAIVMTIRDKKSSGSSVTQTSFPKIYGTTDTKVFKWWPDETPEQKAEAEIIKKLNENTKN
jgi:hypothetical protein